MSVHTYNKEAKICFGGLRGNGILHQMLGKMSDLFVLILTFIELREEL